MQLVSMGFDLEGCKRGVFNTQNQGTTKLTDTTQGFIQDFKFGGEV